MKPETKVRKFKDPDKTAVQRQRLNAGVRRHHARKPSGRALDQFLREAGRS